GLLNIVRLDNIKEKDVNNTSIEDMLLKKLKSNAHVDFQRDKVIVATGVISNLEENIANTFDNHIPKVVDYIGSPDHDFTHFSVHTDRGLENNVYLIMSGLSPINDKVQAISDRIDQIQEKQKTAASEDHALT